MPTNYERLLHMDGERQAWFDAEHVDNQFRDATKMTNLDWLFIDSEQFRQAVSAFAFAHSDECPTSPTQMVDWLMAEHVDDQQDINGTCPNDDETASNGEDSRENLETSNQQISQSDAPKSEETAENAASKCDMDNFDDSRKKLKADADMLAAVFTSTYSNHSELFGEIIELLNRQASITRKTEQAAWIQQANGLIHEANVERNELEAERDVWKMKCETREIAYKQADAERKRYSEQIDELQDKVDRLEAERDALADDLLTCNREREHLRQALGCAIDHAHEIMQLVNIDGEVA